MDPKTNNTIHVSSFEQRQKIRDLRACYDDAHRRRLLVKCVSLAKQIDHAEHVLVEILRTERRERFAHNRRVAA